MQEATNDTEAVDKQTVACVFCHRSSIAAFILQETPTFLLLADHAPLLEGHLLIVPKQHYACYGSVPAELDGELTLLKQQVKEFFTQFYASAIFWEHGVFRQTVFHAHLHCFPFGDITYPSSEDRHARVIHTQEELRAWYAIHGHYFYLEDTQQALLFPPNMDDYIHIIQKVLGPGLTARTHQTVWRTPQQRKEEGGPLIAGLKANWQAFERKNNN